METRLFIKHQPGENLASILSQQGKRSGCKAEIVFKIVINDTTLATEELQIQI